MLLRGLLALIWNNKVVYNALNCRRLLVEVVLVSLEALLAPKEDKAVTQVNLLAIGRGSESISLHVIAVHPVLGRLRVCPLGLVANQT